MRIARIIDCRRRRSGSVSSLRRKNWFPSHPQRSSMMTFHSRIPPEARGNPGPRPWRGDPGRDWPQLQCVRRDNRAAPMIYRKAARLCNTAVASRPKTMKAEFKIFTPPTILARRSLGASAWIAVNKGTTKSPPAQARPATSQAMRIPATDEKNSASPTATGTFHWNPCLSAPPPNLPASTSDSVRRDPPRKGLSKAAAAIKAARPLPTDEPEATG